MWEMNKQNKLEISLLYLAILISYFALFTQPCFFALHEGKIKTWFPTAIVAFVFLINKFIVAKPFIVTKDAVYPIKLLILLYIAIGFISLIVHEENIYYIGKYALHMFSPVVLFIIIFILVRDNDLIDKILILLFLGGVVWSVSIQYDIFLGKEGVASFSGSELSHEGSMEVGVVRYGSGLGINTFAAILIPLPLIGLYFADRATSLLRKSLYYVLSVFLLFSLFLTVSRAAIISMLLGIFMMFWYNLSHSPKKKNTYIMSFCLIILLSFGMVLTNQNVLIRFLQTATQFDVLANSVYVQDKVIEYGIRMRTDEHLDTTNKSLILFKEKPLFGHGFNIIMNDDAYEHNYYLRLLSINGVITFTFFILFLLKLIIITRKTMLRGYCEKHSLKSTGFLLYSGVIAFLFYLNACPSEFYFYWIWFGLTAAWVRNSANEIGKKRLKNESIVT